MDKWENWQRNQLCLFGARKWGINLYKVVRERKFDPKILCSAKLSSELKTETNT